MDWFCCKCSQFVPNGSTCFDCGSAPAHVRFGVPQVPTTQGTHSLQPKLAVGGALGRPLLHPVYGTMLISAGVPLTAEAILKIKKLGLETAALECLDQEKVQACNTFEEISAQVKLKYRTEIDQLLSNRGGFDTDGLLDLLEEYFIALEKLPSDDLEGAMAKAHEQGHELGTLFIASLIGKGLDFPLKTLHNLSFAALLHDVGLHSSGPCKLNLAEHCHHGSALLRNYWNSIPYLNQEIHHAVLYHHDRYARGASYLLPAVRIVAVADAFDDLLFNDRRQQYRACDRIMTEIWGRSCYDPGVVEALARVLRLDSASYQEARLG